MRSIGVRSTFAFIIGLFGLCFLYSPKASADNFLTDNLSLGRKFQERVSVRSGTTTDSLSNHDGHLLKPAPKLTPWSGHAALIPQVIVVGSLQFSKAFLFKSYSPIAAREFRFRAGLSPPISFC